MEIEDRVFIVTGASSGIGLATAVALSGRGAKVALLARSTDALEASRVYRPAHRDRPGSRSGIRSRMEEMKA